MKWEKQPDQKRTGDAWIRRLSTAASSRGLTVNLIVRDVAAALPFYTEVVELRLHYSDPDFAAPEGEDAIRVRLHADHMPGARCS